MLTRREFAATLLAAAGAARLKAAPFGWPIGSQIYPHRMGITSFPDYAKMMAGLGITRLELCSPIGYREFPYLADGKLVRKILADHGMKSESSHFSLTELRQKHAESMTWAHDVGIKQAIVASLDDYSGRAFTLDQVKKAAEEYNSISAATATAGLQQGLHNERYELAIIDGVRVYDRLFELLDPKLVKFQFQMSSVTSGVVGAEYFTKHPGRFISMHLQDIDMNAPEPPPPASGRGRGGRPQVAVGKGSIDWAATFKAAKIGGVKNYFVEQTLELTKESVAFLKALKV